MMRRRWSVVAVLGLAIAVLASPSTAWAVPPTLTATASTFYGSEPPANAIDGSNTTDFTTGGVVAGWLRLQLSTATAVTAYTIRRRDDVPQRNIKDWTFQGSQDGTTFTTLDTQVGITWPTVGQSQTFMFTNTVAYAYYRVNFTANNGDTGYTSIREITLTYSTAPVVAVGWSDEIAPADGVMVIGSALGLFLLGIIAVGTWRR